MNMFVGSKIIHMIMMKAISVQDTTEVFYNCINIVNNMN